MTNGAGSPLWTLSALPAILAPALLAYNLPPSATFLNQAAALIGWGGFLGAILFALGGDQAPAHRGVGTSNRGLAALLAALAATFIAAFLTLAVGKSTSALVLSSAGAIAAAMLAALIGAVIARAGRERDAILALCWALLIAGALSTLVSLVQVYAPHLADGTWIAHPAVPGRASGNLRQPNHLCSLLLWSLMALAWLHEERRLPRALCAVAGALFVFALVLTASRTGWIGEILLVLWGLFDRRLSKATRIGLVATGAAYVVFWLGLTWWAQLAHQSFYGATRLAAQDISSSRYGIWANTLSLIQSHPLFGVGWGEFNFAWSLTPFPGRPVAFFDHTHNLPLQLMVELGLPLGLTVIGLLAYALIVACRAASRVEGPRGAALRTAAMIVVMMVLHSQLEYPLWYLYFLLPTAFALGLCLGSNPRDTAAPVTASVPGTIAARSVLALACAVLAIAGGWSMLDYQRVVLVFAPPDDAPPLSQRIEDGQRSWFFSHHASYAAATTAAHPSSELPALAEASHYLLDTRLMTAWAKALEEKGDIDKARFLADRLREFHNEESKSFFEPCLGTAAARGAALPFQCTPARGRYDERDFR